jgi:CubicO group peptidase (beta-lactamase class C family)
MPKPVAHIGNPLESANLTIVFLGVLGVLAFLALPMAARSEENPPLKDLEKTRERYHLPALGVVTIADGKPGEVVVTGVRKANDVTFVTQNDKFHIGSCTKSMTATLVGIVVDEGKLKWDTTVAGVFPELAAEMRPEYRGVTLVQLLSHHAGMPEETIPSGSPDFRRSRKPLREQRAEYVRLALKETPAAPPGTKYLYANRGYVIAGAMVERVMNESWEDLIRKRLFEPLGMASAGFGWMASPGKVDQPWPHRPQQGRAVAIPPGPGADNPLVIGPAGTVHCSLGDLAKYVAFHLDGKASGKSLLRPETLKMLHTPPFGGDYALGWLVGRRQWGGGTTLNHAGSNTMNYCVIWLGLGSRLGAIAVTNIGGNEAAAACDEAVSAAILRAVNRMP